MNAAFLHLFSGDVNYANCPAGRGTTRVWKLKEHLSLLCLCSLRCVGSSAHSPIPLTLFVRWWWIFDCFTSVFLAIMEYLQSASHLTSILLSAKSLSAFEKRLLYENKGAWDKSRNAKISCTFWPLSERDKSIREIYGNPANFTLLNFHLCSNIVLKAEQKYVVYLELRSARQLCILKGHFVFRQNSKPLGRTSFHMKRITFNWSANKSRDENKAKVSSHHHSCKRSVKYLILMTSNRPNCCSWRRLTVKKRRGQFHTHLYCVLEKFMSITWLQSERWKWLILITVTQSLLIFCHY